MSAAPHSLTLGTRSSALARWQTDWVRAQLQKAWPACECQTRLFTTAGDRMLDKPLPEIGGKGVFTAELENALRQGEIDLAVHSLKDLPVGEAPGLTIGAIPFRDEARDVLIAREGWTLATLPIGARVGTSSLRRAAQLLARRPDLALLPLRGNVDTRLRKAMHGDYEAIVLAAAGVLRLGLSQHITEYLPFEVMLPAPGQGALAVQCRADDATVLALLRPLDEPAARAAVTAERAFLKALGGGCAAPIAAYAISHPQSPPHPLKGTGQRGLRVISLTGLVASPDGQRVVRVTGEGHQPHILGAELAHEAMAHGAEGLLR